MQSFLSRNRNVAVALVFVVIASLFAWPVYRHFYGQSSLVSGRSSVSVEAVVSDDRGVDTRSDFVLSSKDALDESLLKNRLSVTPQTDFSLQKKSDTNFVIHFAKPLRENTVYVFRLALSDFDETAAHGADSASETGPALSWAFQTKNPFRIVSTLPANAATGVPVNSGIEITLSHEGASDIASAFDISPKVDGKFETHKKTIVFVPEKLSPETVYAVTIKKGYGLGGDEVLKEDKVFRFETSSKENSAPRQSLGFVRDMYESSSIDKPALDIYSYGIDTNAKVSVGAFRFSGQEDFIKALRGRDAVPSWASLNRQSHRIDTAAMQKVAGFEASLEKFDSSGYFVFPEALPIGYYVVDAAMSGYVKTQVLLQVTDVSAYVVTSDTKTMVWSNDVKTKAPIAGAKANIVDGPSLSGATDADGILTADTPNALKDERMPSERRANPFNHAAPRYLTITASDGQSLVVLEQNAVGYFDMSPSSDRYWSYLYLDRDLYRPTDSVAFWGMERKRDHPEKKEPIRMTVTNGAATVFEKDLNLSDRDTFSGEIPLDHWDTGSYNVTVRTSSDEILVSEYFTIEDYVKPAYNIGVSSSKKAFFFDESTTVSGKAAFFEGSPVPNMKLDYSESRKSGSVTTDANGNFSFPYAYDRSQDKEDRRYDTQLLSRRTITVRPTKDEEADIEGETNFEIFLSRTGIEVDNSRRHSEDGRYTSKARVFSVDLDKADDVDISENDTKWYQGSPLVGKSVTARLIETSWDKVSAGSYYDFVNKEVVQKYRYSQRETEKGEEKLTSDSHGEVVYRFPMDKEKSYRVVYTVRDDQGRELRQSDYLYGSFSGGRSGNYFMTEKNKESKGIYGVGDKVDLTFQKDDRDLPDGGDNRYLFYRSARGLRSYVTQSNPRYAFDFQEDDIPNVSVSGVYFNGRTYVVGQSYTASFRKEDRKLSIDVKTDKPVYQPKDTVILDVKTQDKDGRPKSAEVNISAVDEAMFALSPQSVDTLRDMYRSVGDGVLQTYFSHRYPTDAALAERGGGDGRSLFMDRAFFGSVRTDENGVGKISFTLPDNLTSWRLSYQGVSDDLYAGSGFANAKVKIPFFVDTVMNSDYVVADKPVMQLRAFGEKLAAGKDIEYTVSIPSLGVENAIVHGKSFQAAAFAFPALQEGDHAVTVKAVSDGLEDTMTKSVHVGASRLSRQESTFSLLRSDMKFEGNSVGLTTLVVSDEGRGKLYSNLIDMIGSGSARLDEKAANIKAVELLRTLFHESYWQQDDFDAETYQAPEGGAKLLSYADSDLSLSAGMASLGGVLGESGLRRYFVSVLDDPKESRDREIIALYGLASLHDPVLLPVDRLLEENDLSVEERLYLGLALAKLGDTEHAYGVLGQVLAKNGKKSGSFMAVQGATDGDENLHLTALAADLAALVQHKDVSLLFDYLTRNSGKDIDVTLEKMIALTAMSSTISNRGVSFEYTLDGKRTTKKLLGGESWRIMLSPDQLASIRFDAIEGNAGVTTTYAKTMDAESLQTSALRVGREYSVGGVPTQEFHSGDMVRISIRYEIPRSAPDGCYLVSDYLPSGMKLVTRLYGHGLSEASTDDVWYPSSVSGQRVDFCAYRNDDTKREPKPIVYYARVNASGEYRAEGPAIQSQQDKSDMSVRHEAQTVRILPAK